MTDAHSHGHGEVNAHSKTPQWLALVVDKVGRDDLEWIGKTGFTKWRDLPTEMVHLPSDNHNVAVVSWRWDIAIVCKWEPQPTYSRNIQSAVIYARLAGIRYLFIDVVSIDQQLPANELLQQVLDFTTLYRRIPVIAAYDTISEDTVAITMRRPWIAFEIQAYQHNPTKVVCVKWRTDGTDTGGCLSLDDELALRFLRGLRFVWRSSFSLTITALLDGEIDMACVGDLKYILPEYAPVLVAAEENELSRADFLLTAAVLVQAGLDAAAATHKDAGLYKDFVSPSVRISAAALSKYTARSSKEKAGWYALQALPIRRDGLGRLVSVVEVSVGSTLVGGWTAIDGADNVLGLFKSHVLESVFGAERAISCALGMTESQFESFLALKAKSPSIRQGGKKSTGPIFEMRSISLS